VKKHLFFKNNQEGLAEYVIRPGAPVDENKDSQKNYIHMANEFEACIESFNEEQQNRHRGRTIDVPSHFDLIELKFQGYYNQPRYEQYYYNTFGLALLHLKDFNKTGLFAINDTTRFNYFFDQMEIFIQNAQEEENTPYDRKIIYLKSFSFYSTEDMIHNVGNYDLIQLNLHSNYLIEGNRILPQKESLTNFLRDNQILFDVQEDHIELNRIDEEFLSLLLDNFDIINAACSSSGIIIKPDAFNLPERTYGFTILIPQGEEIPVVGFNHGANHCHPPVKNTTTI